MYSENILVGVCPGTPKKGVLGAGTAPNKGVLGAGTAQNKRPLGLTAPLSNNTLSMIHSQMSRGKLKDHMIYYELMKNCIDAPFRRYKLLKSCDLCRT